MLQIAYLFAIPNTIWSWLWAPQGIIKNPKYLFIPGILKQFSNSEEKFYSEDRTSIPVMVSVTRLGEDRVHTKLRLFVSLVGVKIKHSGPCKEDGEYFECIMGVAQKRVYKF